MNYEVFKQEITDRIIDFLPEKYANAEVSIHPVVKNNDVKLDGLLVQLEGSNIAPNIYLNPFYEQHEEGRPVGDILAEIAELRTSHEKASVFDVDSITDFEAVKDRISCRLVNAEHNGEYLSDKPHTIVDDLAVTYHIEMGKGEGGKMTAPVTTVLMERYGIDTEKLHSIALKNMEALSPPRLKSMSETMAELLMPDMMTSGMSEEDARRAVESMVPPATNDMLYVLSNEARLHGAAAILNKKIMDDITDKLGKDFFILPSSIHEVLIVPKNDRTDLKDLESMVRDVNASQVSPGERLSDHVYAYDAKSHELFRADKLQERFTDKKPSISDALKIPLPDMGSRVVKPLVAGGDAR